MRKFLKYIKSRIYNSIRYIAYRLTENNNELEMNPLVQRYFLNEKDISISLFPPKDYKIMMWSYDCFGWYINIVGKGCDVYYDAENHELIDVAKTDWNNKHFTTLKSTVAFGLVPFRRLMSATPSACTSVVMSQVWTTSVGQLGSRFVRFLNKLLALCQI